MKPIFKQPIIWSLMAILALSLLSSRGLLFWPKNILFRLAAPWQKFTLETSLKSNNFIGYFNSLKFFKEENEKLREKNETLLSIISLLEQVSKENIFLRAQMNLALPESGQLVLADVVSNSSVSQGRYILINRGRHDKISEGDAAVTAGNILIGRVVEANVSFSKIALIIDLNSRINALTQETGISGLIKVENNNLIMDLIPANRNIKKGEAVITSGLGGIFPTGLLVGQIGRIEAIDAQPFQRAYIESAANFNKLEKVFVMVEE